MLHRSVRRATVAVLVAAVLTALGGAAQAALPHHKLGRVATAKVVAISPKPVPGATQQLGLTMDGAPWDMTGMDALSDAVGRRPDLVMWYAAWSDRAAFPATQASDVVARGATPVITWEPWNPANGVDQPTYALAKIAGGAHDSYISSWAKQIKTWGKPVVLRWGHEMNGSWYPWSAQANGNTPADYVRAFRHVRGIFDKAGATNVAWSWSPNVSYPGSVPLSQVFPGSTYVDRVALDGYNWSTLLEGTVWTSFWDTFAPSIAEVTALTGKPIFIGETASTEVGGDKAAWVRGLFATMKAHPEIRGFTWFQHDKETDWRIDSSASSLDAFRDGLATY